MLGTSAGEYSAIEAVNGASMFVSPTPGSENIVDKWAKWL